MKKQQRIALVCAGPLSSSGVSRLPGIRNNLEWVKSGTPSAASRAANLLGARAVREYGEIQGASIVLVCAPDAAAAGLVEDLQRSGLEWRDRTVVLLDSALDSTALSALPGAHVASLNQLLSPSETLLLEGVAEARKRLRRLLNEGRQNLIEIEQGRKADYMAGMRLGTTEFVPMVAATVDHFVRAGMEKAAAEKTAASLFENSVRAYMRAGKRLLKRRAD